VRGPAGDSSGLIRPSIRAGGIRAGACDTILLEGLAVAEHIERLATRQCHPSHEESGAGHPWHCSHGTSPLFATRVVAPPAVAALEAQVARPARVRSCPPNKAGGL